MALCSASRQKQLVSRYRLINKRGATVVIWCEQLDFQRQNPSPIPFCVRDLTHRQPLDP